MKADINGASLADHKSAFTIFPGVFARCDGQIEKWKQALWCSTLVTHDVIILWQSALSAWDCMLEESHNMTSHVLYDLQEWTTHYLPPYCALTPHIPAFNLTDPATNCQQLQFKAGNTWHAKPAVTLFNHFLHQKLTLGDNFRNGGGLCALSCHHNCHARSGSRLHLTSFDIY